MSECKHGLRSGCSYCHVTHVSPTVVTRPAAVPKKRVRASGLSEKMNDRMTKLQRRLKEIRGQSPS